MLHIENVTFDKISNQTSSNSSSSHAKSTIQWDKNKRVKKKKEQ